MTYKISERVKTFISLIEQYDHSIDGGAILSGLAAEINTETDVKPTDVALGVRWVDEEGLVFEESFSYEEIDNARSDGDKIFVTNTEGAPASFKFYQVTPAPFDASLFNPVKSRSPG